MADGESVEPDADIPFCAPRKPDLSVVHGCARQPVRTAVSTRNCLLETGVDVLGRDPARAAWWAWETALVTSCWTAGNALPMTSCSASGGQLGQSSLLASGSAQSAWRRSASGPANAQKAFRANTRTADLCVVHCCCHQLRRRADVWHSALDPEAANLGQEENPGLLYGRRGGQHQNLIDCSCDCGVSPAQRTRCRYARHISLADGLNMGYIEVVSLNAACQESRAEGTPLAKAGLGQLWSPKQQA